jgi:CBS domain-containing protein
VLVDGNLLETLRAADIMSRTPTTVDVETPLEEVTKLLRWHYILRVPVTDRGRLVGIIPRSELIKSVLEPEFMAI